MPNNELRQLCFLASRLELVVSAGGRRNRRALADVAAVLLVAPVVVPLSGVLLKIAVEQVFVPGKHLRAVLYRVPVAVDASPAVGLNATDRQQKSSNCSDNTASTSAQGRPGEQVGAVRALRPALAASISK